MIDESIREVEQFLYREARLLDERRFREWLALSHRRCPLPDGQPRQPLSRSSKAIAILDPERYSRGGPRPGRTNWRSSTKTQATLAAPRRPARHRHGLGGRPAVAHPAPDHQYRGRARRVEASPLNFIVYRSRGETEQDFYVGAREDMLRHATAR